MIEPRSAQLYTVYVLHFDRPVGRVSHYCGICKAERLHKRQMTHLAGSGARLTARAVALGIGWTVAAAIPTTDPQLEKRIKRAGHLAARCEICKTGLHNLSLPLDRVRYAPIQREGNYSPFGW